MYLSGMILLVWIVAIGFAVYMLQRNLARTERNHERTRERFYRLLEQLKNSKENSPTDLEKKNEE